MDDEGADLSRNSYVIYHSAHPLSIICAFGFVFFEAPAQKTCQSPFTRTTGPEAQEPGSRGLGSMPPDRFTLAVGEAVRSHNGGSAHRSSATTRSLAGIKKTAFANRGNGRTSRTEMVWTAPEEGGI